VSGSDLKSYHRTLPSDTGELEDAMLRPRLIQLLLLGAILAPLPATGQDEAADADCPVCRLWTRFDASVLSAKREVAALPDGAVYFFHSDNFRVVEDLQRFAYERQGLEESGAARRHPKLGTGHGPGDDVHLEIAASAHGVFAILTSDNPEGARTLREQASYAIRRGTRVRF
jgi:hypothetical protein